MCLSNGDVMIRLATLQDAADLARIINDAFIVEAFFKIGDRTSAEEIAALMNAGGEFLVLENVEPGTGTGTGTGTETLTGCVYLTCTGDRAYFGMLSIAPALQRQGLGRRLIDAAEGRARERGCRVIRFRCFAKSLSNERTMPMPSSICG